MSRKSSRDLMLISNFEKSRIRDQFKFDISCQNRQEFRFLLNIRIVIKRLLNHLHEKCL